jgi:hypothetical protein
VTVISSPPPLSNEPRCPRHHLCGGGLPLCVLDLPPFLLSLHDVGLRVCCAGRCAPLPPSLPPSFPFRCRDGPGQVVSPLLSPRACHSLHPSLGSGLRSVGCVQWVPCAGAVVACPSTMQTLGGDGRRRALQSRGRRLRLARARSTRAKLGLPPKPTASSVASARAMPYMATSATGSYRRGETQSPPPASHPGPVPTRPQEQRRRQRKGEMKARPHQWGNLPAAHTPACLGSHASGAPLHVVHLQLGEVPLQQLHLVLGRRGGEKGKPRMGNELEPTEPGGALCLPAPPGSGNGLPRPARPKQIFAPAAKSLGRPTAPQHRGWPPGTPAVCWPR